MVLQDVILIFVLAFLEAILSIDNAVVLALLAKPLAPELQRKALTYGLAGSIVFRLLAIAIFSVLIRWTWIKFLGGGYLIAIALYHFFRPEQHAEKPHHTRRGFWRTVLAIELMDIVFAVDSILAAIALTPKFWIVFAGGMLGVVMVRFAASIFLFLLRRFPRFESTASWMILVIGAKLVLEGLHLPGVEFGSHGSPAFWGFWGALLLCFVQGFWQGFWHGFRPGPTRNSPK